MPIVLVIKQHEDVHSVLLTMKPIIIGRSSASDIKVSDDQVSGRHLALKVAANGKVLLKDLDSTNGTYLNGAQIKESYLMIDDQLSIGEIQLSLDESQMTYRERKVLSREVAPTQVKYINLSENNEASANHKDVQQTEVEKKPRPTPTIVFPDSEIDEAKRRNSQSEGHEPTTTVTKRDEIPRVFDEHRKIIDEQAQVAKQRQEEQDEEVDQKEDDKTEKETSQPQKTNKTNTLSNGVKEKVKIKKKKPTESLKKTKETKKKKKSFFQEIVGIFKRD